MKTKPCQPASFPKRINGLVQTCSTHGLAYSVRLGRCAYGPGGSLEGKVIAPDFCAETSSIQSKRRASTGGSSL